MISGAAWLRVALTWPERVSNAVRMRAMPKSTSFGAPKVEKRTFSGFTSRWMIPLRCAVSSAPARAAPHASTSRGSAAPAVATRWASDPRGRNSMTR